LNQLEGALCCVQLQLRSPIHIFLVNHQVSYFLILRTGISSVYLNRIEEGKRTLSAGSDLDSALELAA
jgi:hypothetical protein